MRVVLQGARAPLLWSLLAMLAAPASASAQAPGAAPAAMATAAGTRLILLGTGAGPIPRKDRSQPANLLVVGGRPYLIDAGNGVSRQLVRAGYVPSDVRTVFITHHHIDHNADMGALMSFAWVEDNKRRDASAPPMRFYGPAPTAALVQVAQQFLSVSERIFRAGVPMAPVAGRFEGYDVQAPGVVFRDDRIVVSAIENTHYAGTAPGVDKSYSYRFDTPGRAIVFCGDTGPSEALTALAKDADVLVCEVNDLDASMKEVASGMQLPPQALMAMRHHMEAQHITPEQIGQMAQKANVKSVVLTHFSPGLDGEQDHGQYTDGVRKYFHGPVIAGHDLLEY
ncbi:MBL fold metallo-hydrolase [Duganella sp. FT3S]|uniref:MBL fold metallo-hydrolase n=1 Tax=Rugamonas fusca TaxID=2758568 RepID=A0A7W2EE48_9BURK|nr:MBL fold metallo-hydrolase [Rugamonas fusca]MBA5604260.1 MBL fold metallo-hydrolase [Rugamonas fusca]